MKLKLSRRTGTIIKLALAPLPVPIHEIRPGLMVAEVMGTGTLEARVKTTASPRIQERLAEVLARLDDGELKLQVEAAEVAMAAVLIGDYLKLRNCLWVH
jgi:hypothetical protein